MNVEKSQRIGNKGFTLVEIIVVVAIIGMLMGLLFPVVRAAFEKGKSARTQALISRIDAALYKYQSEYRDYPPSIGGGGTLADNEELYWCLAGRLISNPPPVYSPTYLEFNSKELKQIGGVTYIIDGWRYPLLYTHFTDYVPGWGEGGSPTQPWRYLKKKFEFQLIAAGVIAQAADGNSDGKIETSELDNLDNKEIDKLIKNW